MQRQKRKYEKKKTSFWFEGGKAQVVKNFPRISTLSNLEKERSRDPFNDHIETNHTETNPRHEAYQQEDLKQKTVKSLRDILFNLTGEPVQNKSKKSILIDSILYVSHKSPSI